MCEALRVQNRVFKNGSLKGSHTPGSHPRVWQKHVELKSRRQPQIKLQLKLHVTKRNLSAMIIPVVSLFHPYVSRSLCIISRRQSGCAMARSTISNGMCFVIPARPLLDDLWAPGWWVPGFPFSSGVTSRMSCDPDLGRGVFLFV